MREILTPVQALQPMTITDSVSIHSLDVLLIKRPSVHLAQSDDPRTMVLRFSGNSIFFGCYVLGTTAAALVFKRRRGMRLPHSPDQLKRHVLVEEKY